MLEIFEDIRTLLILGGPVVVVLLVASVFGLALAFRKFQQFSKVKQPVLKNLHLAVEQWHTGERKTALEIFDNSHLVIARDLRFILEQNSKVDSDYLYDETLRRSAEFLRGYAKNFRFLELIYSLAPVPKHLSLIHISEPTRPY